MIVFLEIIKIVILYVIRIIIWIVVVIIKIVAGCRVLRIVLFINQIFLLSGYLLLNFTDFFNRFFAKSKVLFQLVIFFLIFINKLGFYINIF